MIKNILFLKIKAKNIYYFTLKNILFFKIKTKIIFYI